MHKTQAKAASRSARLLRQGGQQIVYVPVQIPADQGAPAGAVPAQPAAVLAQRALDQVFGVDLNPNVVAIARFRLLIAALQATRA